jgi:NADH dehydrogenase
VKNFKIHHKSKDIMMTQTNAPVATVIGGSGFIGRYIVSRLARQGWRVKVAVRRPDKATFVRMYGTVGQVEPVQVNLRYEDSLRPVLAKSDAVINCVGLLAPCGKQTFDVVQVKGARSAARIAKEVGAESFVHISAIGADKASQAEYARTKAEGEEAVLEAFPTAKIIRPSIVFGAEDKFFNRFAAMARFSPILPIIGGETKFQPVYVDDIARAIENLLVHLPAHLTQKNTIFEVGGSEVYTFHRMMEIMLDVICRKRLIVDVPMPIAKIKASVLQYLPNAPLTPDQVIMLERDNVVSGNFGTLNDLQVTPQLLETVLPKYLEHYRPRGQFQQPLEREI